MAALHSDSITPALITARDPFTGYWRRIRIVPGKGVVLAELEDDYHCMAVTVTHDGHRALTAEADMRRVPWTTCPGAADTLRDTFAGVALDEFLGAPGKRQNCTHLYDLATFAAAHAQKVVPLEYNVFVTDPVEGERSLEIWRDDEKVFTWLERDARIVEPAEIAGKNLFEISDYIRTLAPDLKEAAAILRWASIVASGRGIPMIGQSDPRKMPTGCYTFQPERVDQAKRTGHVRDFSRAPGATYEEPLDGN